MFSPLEQFNAIFLFSDYCLNHWLFGTILIFLDISFSQIIVPLVWLSFFLLLIFFFGFLYNIIFTNVLQRSFEYTINFILNLIKQQIGVFGFAFLPLIFFIFFKILLLNLLSLLPFGIALTSHLIIILYLSLSICIGIFFEGYIRLGDVFYKIFLPSSPLVMLPLLLLIELFSYIIRMFSLAIRLVANIMAGHTLIYIISSFTLMISSLNPLGLIIGIFLICTIMLLELGVACLQAYVFTILILIYINDIYSSNH